MSDKTSIKEEVFFPKQKDFKFLLIKPKDISNIRPDNPEYKHFICNLDIYEEIFTTSDDFFEKMGKALDVDKMTERNKPYSLHTQYIGSNSEYIYELIHFDLMPKDLPLEIYNGVANLLKTDYQHLFGNAIMIKTKIPVDKVEVEMVDCERKDLYNLLEDRVRHIGVKVDDDGETEEFNWYYEDPKKFIEEFMVNEYKFVEKAFMLHNLQIYYTPGNRMDMKKLIGEGYDQIIIATKITEQFYGNFTLVEFNDIKSLLDSECPLECPEDWKKPSKELEERLKEEKRKFIFNKYRALWKAKEIYLE